MHLLRWVPLFLLLGCAVPPGAEPADGGWPWVSDSGTEAQSDGGPFDGGEAADAGSSPADGGGGDAGLDGGEALDGGSDAGLFWSHYYPPHWAPGFAVQGQFLHDFSYAGYRRGEVSLPGVSGPIQSVAAWGADPGGQQDSTQAIQHAIDASPDGGVVWIPAGTYRIDGQLAVKRSGVVLRGEGAVTRLRFTRTAQMNDKAHLEFAGQLAYGPHLPLVAEAATWDRVVRVQDASSLSVGDDVAIGWHISPDFVAEHQMTGSWGPFNNTWQTFFWRTVTAVNTQVTPHQLELDIPLRYPGKLRDGVSVRKVSGYLSECGLEDLAVSNADTRAVAWTLKRVHAIRFAGVKDCWMRNVHSFQPPGKTGHLLSGGVKVLSSKRVTLQDSSMANAQHRGPDGNGYLFELSMAGEVLVQDVVATGGRHNFIQNWGFGTSGCVFLRCQSRDGRAQVAEWDPIGYTAYSEFHHSLAMANLIEGGEYDDGFAAENRGSYSSGAGHSATQNVFWNVGGTGVLQSKQFGWGYVIGAASTLTVSTSTVGADGAGTAPADVVESVPPGMKLTPTSLYESQRRRRLQLP